MKKQVRPPDVDSSGRELLATAGAVGAAVLAGCAAPRADTDPETPSSAPPTRQPETPSRAPSTRHTSPDLERWADSVPRPDVVEPVGVRDGHPRYEVAMNEFEQSFHRDLPATTTWGYEGQFPGPTIEARQGEPIYVEWQNELPDDHLLPVDTSIHGDIVPYDVPGVWAVTHLHGGNVEDESDGTPQAWYTRDFEETGPDFTKRDYCYMNDQPSATLWYHDHALAITRLNVYAGLAGFYLLRRDRERDLGLPSGEHEIPLVLQDKSLNPDGSLYYPTTVADPVGGGDGSDPGPSIVPQFYGDTSVVNGRAWPRLSVGPGTYRFRLLNGANSRFYNLKLLSYDEQSGATGDDGPPFVQIGNDGGPLSEPVTTAGRLELGSSQRADVVVEFTDHAGETLLLHNDAPAEYRGQGGDPSDLEPLPEVMLVDVEATGRGDDTGPIPDELARVPEIPVESADRERSLTLALQNDDHRRSIYLLGTDEDPAGNHLVDTVTEEPRLGDTEVWSLANLTGLSHPVHLHLVHFQVLGRRPASDHEPGESEIDTDGLDGPESYELGWNDVVTVHPGEVVHVIVQFGEYEGLFNGQTGDYMWHCHMLEHEDHDMMRPFSVLLESTDGTVDAEG